MPFYVAEYLGERTDVVNPVILPTTGLPAICPFNGQSCRKIASSDKKAPICSLKDSNRPDVLWIVCEERLISTKVPLTKYQLDSIHRLAQAVFSRNILPTDYGIKAEVSIPLPGRNLRADYILRLVENSTVNPLGPKGFIMEVQGGGETSNTGTMQRHVKSWESLNGSGTNSQLSQNLPVVSPIVTNAWRRLQEQVFVKAAIAKASNYGFLACVSSRLFDTVQQKLRGVKNLAGANWEIAFIAFIEDTSSPPISGPIPIKVDSNRMLFTSFSDFLLAIGNQGIPVPMIFQGSFFDGAGNSIIIL